MSKILIVEDEIIIRTALRKLLTRNKYDVKEASSVKEAGKFNLDSFDLIISDLRLPGAPGTDLIQAAGDVPVLIMTSYASLRSAVDSMRMGAVDIFEPKNPLIKAMPGFNKFKARVLQGNGTFSVDRANGAQQSVDTAVDVLSSGYDLTMFMEEYSVTELSLDRVIRLSYDLMGLQSFFTVGEDECRAWSIARDGWVSRDASGPATWPSRPLETRFVFKGPPRVCPAFRPDEFPGRM